MTSTHKRAAKGGEYGANGEWYEGGKFINTVPDNAKGHKETKKATGKQEKEPYVWEVAPDGKRSLYRLLSGIERIESRNPLRFAFNTDLRQEYATPEAIEQRKARIAAFNAGERWV